MFNNKFNSSKKDPLVEAVEGAMQDGNLRRQAIAYVNEQFGVFSRNAVVNEHKAAYDYALEEAYGKLKEGKPLDPVGREDKDVDNDGDHDKSDKYLLKRRAAIGKAMGKRKQMEEESDGLPPSDAAKQAAKQTSTPASTPKKVGNAAGSTISSARDAAGMNEARLDELKAPTGKTARQVMDRVERRDDEISDWTRSNRIYKSMKKRYPGKSARNQKDTGKADLPNTGNVEFHKAGYPGHVTKGGKLTKSASKETKSDIRSRLGKHTKPHLPEGYELEEARAVKKDIAKGGVTAPKDYSEPRHPNPGAITSPSPMVQSLKEAWKKLKEAKKEMKEARKCMEEDFDSFDFSNVNEAFANYIAETINVYGAINEHPEATVENLHMFNEAYVAAVLAEAEKCKYEEAVKHDIDSKEHEDSMKEARELRKARKEVEKEAEKKELDEAKEYMKGAAKHDTDDADDADDTKKKKVLAKTLKHLARKKAMAEELQIDEVSAFGQAFRAAGGKNFTFGGKTYSGARADGKSASTSAASTPGTQGVATGKSFKAIDRAQSAASKAGPADNPGLRNAPGASSMPKTSGTVARDTGITGKPGGETGVTSGSTVSLDRQGNVGASPSAPAAPAPKPNAPTTATSGSTPAGAKPTTSSGLVGPDAGKMATPEKPAPTTSQPGAPKDDASAGVKKVMGTMNESVQVGDNKYRIF